MALIDRLRDIVSPRPDKRPDKDNASSALGLQRPPDLVDGLNALAAYYRYLEADAYDAGLKVARDRRDFRDDFLRRIDAILAYQTDNDARRLIQHEIEKEVAAFESGLSFQPSRDVDLEARTRDAAGYALLALSTPLTWESLRAAYRDAAKKHHPDVGGDVVTMQHINDAYSLFTAILRRSGAQQAAIDGQPLIVVDSVERLFRKVLLTKLAGLIDDLAGDTAFVIYSRLTMEDIEQAYRGVDLVARLCELLAAAGKSDDAAIVLRNLKSLTERAAARRLNYQPLYIGASEGCKDPKRIRFIPNHIRQADNLLRLGIIDRERYDALAKRIGFAQEKVHKDQAAFADYLRGRQFLKLPKDPVLDDTPIGGLVPAPGYYSRVETLSPAELSEYARAFHSANAQLVLKYLAVRLDALLRAPFMGFTNIAAILEELRFISAAPGLPGTLPQLCQEAIKVVDFLNKITTSERQERIELLNSLDAVPGSPTVLTVTVDVSSGDFKAQKPRLQRPIFLNPQFTEFAIGPLERIERYVRTGSGLTVGEQQAERQRLDESRAFHESEVYKRAREVTWAKRADPQEVVAAVSSLCEAIYARIAQGDRVGEIAYWTNALTTNLVKLRRFQEALQWFQRLDGATPEVCESLSPSMALAMAKRRERCINALKKTDKEIKIAEPTPADELSRGEAVPGQPRQ